MVRVQRGGNGARQSYDNSAHFFIPQMHTLILVRTETSFSRTEHPLVKTNHTDRLESWKKGEVHQRWHIVTQMHGDQTINETTDFYLDRRISSEPIALRKKGPRRKQSVHWVRAAHTNKHPKYNENLKPSTQRRHPRLTALTPYLNQMKL